MRVKATPLSGTLTRNQVVLRHILMIGELNTLYNAGRLNDQWYAYLSRQADAFRDTYLKGLESITAAQAMFQDYAMTLNGCREPKGGHSFFADFHKRDQ